VRVGEDGSRGSAFLGTEGMGWSRCCSECSLPLPSSPTRPPTLYSPSTLSLLPRSTPWSILHCCILSLSLVTAFLVTGACAAHGVVSWQLAVLWGVVLGARGAVQRVKLGVDTLELASVLPIFALKRLG
jgi:hypothetical protein